MNIIKKSYKWNGPIGQRTLTNIIVLHHAKAKVCGPDDIDMWHKQRGWIGIGYHAFIRKDGTIYTGRPFDAVGAHVEGRNYDSVGISFEGDFEEELPTEQQMTACVELVQFLRKHYGNIPVVGHRDVGNSSCPGKLFPMDDIQKRIGVKELNFDEALKLLVEKGVLSSPDYWLKVASIVKYFDAFVINVANKLK